MRHESFSSFISLILIVILVCFVIGCDSNKEAAVPTGNEVQAYLDEHPEIAQASEDEDLSDEEEFVASDEE